MDAKALLQSLDELAQAKRGEITLKKTEIIPPPVNVKKIRGDLGLYQS